MRPLLVSILWLCAVLCLPAGAWAEHFRLAMASDDDQYVADIFKLALENAGGDHTFEVVHRVILAQDRALRVLAEPHRLYDVHYSGYDVAREHAFAMVHFPLTRGLLGMRLLAVREADLPRLAAVRDLASLKEITLGSGNDWPDTRILQRAGLNVAIGTDSTLWPMLARHRFDAYPRGMNEILAELETEGHGKYGENFVIDPYVMLMYRYDHFFYFAKEKKDMADIVERGLRNAYANGSFQNLFESNERFTEILALVRALKPAVVRIDNPLSGPGVEAVPNDYWLTPDW